jgi:hypothetical protein
MPQDCPKQKLGANLRMESFNFGWLEMVTEQSDDDTMMTEETKKPVCQCPKDGER